MNFSKFFKIIDDFLLSISIAVITLIGLLVIISSFGISLTFIPTKTLSMIISSSGSIIGTFFLSYSLRKHDEKIINDNKIDLKNEIIKEKIIEDKLKKITEIELENDNLRTKINNLKSMKLNVNSVSRILELGVAEADMSSTYFKRQIISEEKVKIGRDEIHEFIGAFNYCYKAKLGIDLSLIRIRELDDTTIEVSGFKTGTLGNKNIDIKSILSEIRIKKSGSNFLSDTYTIDNTSNLSSAYAEEQRIEIQELINNGVELGSFDIYVRKYAMDFLDLLLSPLNKRIHFVEDQNSSGQNLQLFFLEHNKNIEQQIIKLNNNITSIEHFKI